MNQANQSPDYPNEGLILTGAVCPKSPNTALLKPGYRFEEYNDKQYGMQPRVCIALDRDEIIAVLQDLLTNLPGDFVSIRYAVFSSNKTQIQVWQRYCLETLVAASVFLAHEDLLLTDGFTELDFWLPSKLDHTYIRLSREKLLFVFRDVRRQCFKVLNDHTIPYDQELVTMDSVECSYFLPEEVNRLRTDFIEDIGAESAPK